MAFIRIELNKRKNRSKAYIPSKLPTKGEELYNSLGSLAAYFASLQPLDSSQPWLAPANYA